MKQYQFIINAPQANGTLVTLAEGIISGTSKRTVSRHLATRHSVKQSTCLVTAVTGSALAHVPSENQFRQMAQEAGKHPISNQALEALVWIDANASMISSIFTPKRSRRTR